MSKMKNFTQGSLIGGVLGGVSNIIKPEISILGRHGVYPPSPLDPLTNKIIEKIVEIIFQDNSKHSSSITEEDSKQISQLIAKGREQGLEELEIKISKDLGAKLEASATLPIEVPINVSASLDKKSNGEYSIKVKYVIIQASAGDEQIKYLRELHKLHNDGILTDAEYADAKKKALEKL